jgi:hypothetical protein
MDIVKPENNGIVNDLANNKAFQRVVNYGSKYLNNKLNYGLAYAKNYFRQYDVMGYLPDQWSIIDESGEKVFGFDSFVSADLKTESKVIHAPVEQGSFVSYNVVTTPTELSCTLSKRGFQSDLMAFVDSLLSYVNSTDLVTVVTPEQEFQNMKLIKCNYNRSAENGTDIIFAELNLIEVREVKSQYTSVRVARRQQRGTQQGKETSALAGIKGWFK